MLFMLTTGCCQQIFSSCTDLAGRETGRYLKIAPFQKLEEALGVLLLLVGGFFKNIGYLNIPFLFATDAK